MSRKYAIHHIEAAKVQIEQAQDQLNKAIAQIKERPGTEPVIVRQFESIRSFIQEEQFLSFLHIGNYIDDLEGRLALDPQANPNMLRALRVVHRIMHMLQTMEEHQ